MWRYLVALLLNLSFISAVMAQSDQLSGIWEIVVQSTAAGDPLSEGKVVVISQEGTALAVLDLQDKRPPEKGSMDGREVKFDLTFQTRDGQEVRGTLRGRAEDNKLRGNVVIRTRELKFEGSRLESVWACSNHTNPVHTAKSEEEMRRLTGAHGCQGWRRLQSANAHQLLRDLATQIERARNKP